MRSREGPEGRTEILLFQDIIQGSLVARYRASRQLNVRAIRKDVAPSHEQMGLRGPRSELALDTVAPDARPNIGTDSSVHHNPSRDIDNDFEVSTACLIELGGEALRGELCGDQKI